MRPSRPLVLVALVFSLGGAACSSSDANPMGTADSGKPDTGKTDTSVQDSGGDTLAADTSVGDSNLADTKTGDTSTGDAADGAVPSCDPHTGDECNLVTNDCTGNKTCVYTSAGHNQCQSLTIGPNAEGDACDESKNQYCDVGLECFTSGSGTAGVCTRRCCENTDCQRNGLSGKCDRAFTNASGAIVFHACSYSETYCHPFKYDCPSGQYCIYTASPDVFTCSTPVTAIGQAPGGACNYRNDCGESQGCLGLTLGDGGAEPASCRLFCWLKQPTGFSVGTTPGGRFAANGTCKIGTTSYGTCTSVGFPDYSSTGGGQLGICR
jgi:hypothetical protein